MLPLFLRITVVVALALVALMLLGFILKIVFVAALVAALVVGVMLAIRLVRRRQRGGPVVMHYRR